MSSDSQLTQQPTQQHNSANNNKNEVGTPAEEELWLTSLREKFQSASIDSTSKLILSSHNDSNYHNPSKKDSHNKSHNNGTDDDNTFISKAFQEMMEVCLISFIAIYSPPSPSTIISLFNNSAATTTNELPTKNEVNNEDPSTESELINVTNPSDTAANNNTNSKSQETLGTPTSNSMQEKPLSVQEEAPVSTVTSPSPPIPTTILETFWSQVLHQYYFRSHPDQQHNLLQRLLPTSTPTSIGVSSEKTTATNDRRCNNEEAQRTEVTEANYSNIRTLLPLVNIIKEALLHSQLIIEDEEEKISSTKSIINNESPPIHNTSIKIHPSAFKNGVIGNISQRYLVKQTVLISTTESDDERRSFHCAAGILNFLRWNDLFLSIVDSIISSFIDNVDTNTSSLLPEMPPLISAGSNNEDSLSFEKKYAIEYMTSHFFRFFSILLVIPTELKISFDDEGYGTSEAYHRNKSRLIYWMTNPNFVQYRIWLHIPNTITPMDDTELIIERQLLENGLLYLDSCYKLLVLMLQEEKNYNDDNNPYHIFLKMHSIVESHLINVYNIVQPDLEKNSASTESKDESSNFIGERSMAEGTRLLQKQRYEKIIKEYRERKREREALVLEGKKFTKKDYDLTKSTQVKSIPLDAMTSVSTIASKNRVDDIEEGETKRELELLNKQSNTNQGVTTLKIAIGLGRIMHSVAVSLGRSAMDLPVNSSNESYVQLATQLEMDLYKKSLLLFESIARFQENHAELLSSSAANNKLSDLSALSLTNPYGSSHELKSSDAYIQNQLDIADTLSCMGFVQDTKLHLYEDALLSYKRSLDIYSFYMGSRSEAVEKSLHNIAILHVAIAKTIKDSISPDDGYSDEDQHRKIIRSHYEESLDTWRSVLQCLESNEPSSQDETFALNTHFLEVARTMHYMAKVYDLLDDEDNLVHSLEMGLIRLQQSTSDLNDDGLDLKCTMITDLTDVYFTRKEYSKIVQLLSNDALHLLDFLSDRETCEGSWYCYVLGESHLNLHNDELALKFLYWYLCSLQILQPVPKHNLNTFITYDIQDIIDLMFSNFASNGLKLHFDSRHFAVLGKYEVLYATFHLAVLLKNQVPQIVKKLSEAEAPGIIKDLVCMFQDIRVTAASFCKDCVANGDQEKSKDLQILIANTLFFMGELYFMSEMTISEAADIFTEALEGYQDLQRSLSVQIGNAAPLSLDSTQRDLTTSVSSTPSHLFDVKQLKTLSYMGHCFRKLGLYDDSMQCYKTALQIQRRLSSAMVDVTEKSSEISKNSGSPSDDFELNLAITDIFSGIGFLYADNNHCHASPHMALRYLGEAATRKQQLVLSSSTSEVRHTLLEELVNIYELMMDITEMDLNAHEQLNHDIISDSTSLSLKDKLCHILFCLGNVFGLLQRYAESSETYRRCLTMLKFMNREEELTYGSIMHNYALVLEKLGGADNLYYAQKAYETSLAVTEKLLGKTHPVLGDTLHGIGSIILDRCLIDQYDTAFQYLTRALSVRLASLGNEHIKVSQTMLNIARIHFIRGQHEKAVSLLEKVLQIQRRIHGPDHISLVDSLELLAEARIHQSEIKDYSIAISCFREAARIRELTIGIQDVSTLSTLTRTASLHALNGENTDALALYEKVLPFYRSAMIENGKDRGNNESQTDIISVLNAMGVIHMKLRHNEDAKQYFFEALDILEQFKLVTNNSVSETPIMGDQSILTLHCLAVILDKLGQRSTALQFYTRVIVACRKDLGSDCLLVAHLASRIGNIIIDQFQANIVADDKLREAEGYLNEALLIFSKEWGSNNEWIGSIHFFLAYVGVRVKCETLAGKEETLEHLFHALDTLENPSVVQDFSFFPDSTCERWNIQQSIQSEWTFEVMKNFNRMERTKLCLQDILSLSSSLEPEYVSSQEKATMLFKLGNIFAKEGNYDEAILNYERTLEIQRAAGTESILDLSNTLHNYGHVLMKNKQPEFALAAYQESLSLAKSKLGDDQEEIAETMNSIGNVCRKLKLLEEAKQNYAESLRIRRHLFGKDDPSILDPLLNLATIQVKHGEYEAAMTAFKNVLRISKASSLGETFEVATALQGIANIHTTIFSDYAKAISCLQAASNIWKSLFGANHLKVADTTLHLGMVHDRMGNFNKAKELYDEALAQYKLLKGAESLQVAKVLGSIGLVQDETSQHEAAAENFQAALLIYNAHSLDNCVDAADCSHNLGVAYNKMGLLDSALTCYNNALRAYAHSLAKGDARVAKTLHAKGVILSLLRHQDKALTCFLEAHEIMKEKLSEESEEIAESKYCIGKLLLQVGNDDGALTMLNDALQIKLKLSENNRLSVANIYHCQGLIYAGKKEHTEAINRFKSSLKIQSENPDMMDNEIRETNFRLGCSLQELGEFREALRYFDEALRIKEGNHTAYTDILEVSNILLHKGQVHLNFENQIEQAFECFQRSLKLRESIGVKDDVSLARTLVGLGHSLHCGGVDYDGAIDNYVRAMALYTLHLESHEVKAEVARVYHLLGTAKFQIGQYDDALLDLKEALHQNISLFGEDSSKVSLSLHTVGLVFSQQQKTDDALLALLKAIEIQQRLNSGSEHIMVMKQDLAKIYALKGHPDKALSLLKDVLQNFESLAPADKQLSLVKHAVTGYELQLEILVKNSGFSLAVADVYIKKGSALGSAFDYRQSAFCFRKALEIQTGILGEGNERLASTLHNLGVAETKAGDLVEAEIHLMRSIEIMRAGLNRDNEDVAETVCCLADVMCQQSNYEEAIRLYRESTSIQRLFAKGGSLNLARTLFKLGFVAESLKNYKTAIACYKECLSIRKSLLGGEHPLVATVLLHMGNILKAQHEYGEAIAYYQSSLEIKQLSSREDDFSIAHIISNMGSARAALGENDSAKVLFLRALSIYRQVLGPKVISEIDIDAEGASQSEESLDEETKKDIKRALGNYYGRFEDRLNDADILFNVAALFEQLSGLTSARKFYSESASMYRAQPIQDMLKLTNALYRVGAIYNTWKLYEKALGYFEECLQIRRKILGDVHEDVEALLNVVGDLYQKMGDSERMYQYLKEAVTVKDSREGTATVDQNSAILNLATSAYENSDLPRALALYKDALAKQRNEFGENNVLVGRTLHSIGTVLKELGDTTSALKFFADALKIFREQSGLDSLELANTSFAMGILYFDLKRFDDAMSMYTMSLEARKVKLGDNHIKVGATFNNMGAVQYEMAHYEKAVFFFSKALEIFGPNHEGAGHIYSGLAYAYRQLGKNKEASDCFERALNIKTDSLGADHIEVGDLLQNYGIFLADDCKKISESAKYLEQALRIKDLCLGHNSLEVSETLFQLSKVYDGIGRLGGAIEALNESICIRENFLLLDDSKHKGFRDDNQLELLSHYDFLMQLMESSDAPCTDEYDLKKADVACKKGNIQMVLRNYVKAIECYEAALTIQIRILGFESLAVSNTLHNLGSAELKNKDFELAGQHLEQSIVVRKKVLDEDDLELADTLHNLANVCRNAKDFGKAIQLFEDSSQIKRLFLGNGHVSLADTLYAMGSALVDIQSYEKAMRCFMDCLRIRRLKLGLEHISVSNALFSIGNIHKARSESERALQVYRETLKIRRKIMEEHSPEIASVLHNMASVLESLKQYEEALQCYEECLKISEVIFGKEDLKVATVLLNLGGLLAEIEGYVDALECYQRCLQIRRNNLGEEDLKVAEVLLCIGMTEEKLNADDNAMKNYVAALQIFEKNGGLERSEAVARVMHGMALIYAKKSDYDNAFKFANESARIRSIMSTSDMPEDVADLFFLLGSLHQLRDEVDEALSLFLQSEQIYRRRLGDENIAVGNALFSIGLMKEVKGAHLEAMKAFQESLRIKQNVLGANDLDVGNLYYKLGCLHKLHSEYDVASKMLQQALQIQSLKLGPACEEVGHTELVLGNVYESLLDWDAASDSYEKALRIFQELDADPLLVAKALNAFGGARDELGDIAKAIELFEESIRLYQQELLQEKYQLNVVITDKGAEGPTDHNNSAEERLRRLHLDFADAYFNLGSAYDKAHNDHNEKALQFYRASLEMYVKLIGKDCVDVAKVLNCMGILYGKNGNYVLSLRLLAESLRIRELFFGRESLDVAASLFAIGVVHDKVTEYTEALDCYTEALRIRQSLLGENCVEVAETLVNLGVVEGNMGNLEKSIQNWKKSLLIYRRCGFSDEDKAVIAIKENMDVAKKKIEMISQVHMYL